MLLLKVIAGFFILYIVIKVASWFTGNDDSPVSLDFLWDHFDDSDGSDSSSSDSGSSDSGGGD